jgi:uncharacterized protein YkwD
MTLSDYFLFLQKLITLFPFTVLDIVFFICALIFIASEKNREFVKSLIITIVICFIWGISLLAYAPLSVFLQGIFVSSKGVNDGFSVLLVTGVLGAIMAIAYRLVIINGDQDLFTKKIPLINIILGGITFCIITSILVATLLSFPLTPFIKSTIGESIVLTSLNSYTQALESREQKLIGKDSLSTLNFLTVDPEGVQDTYISRGPLFSPDETENAMILNQVNHIRDRAGVPDVQRSESASEVAQVLGLKMASTNKLSRTNISGSTPFDLLAQSSTIYTQAYFMVAQAQTKQIAIQGFEQIPQYRLEITSPRYTQVGISSISLKEHGYLVTLFFTD